MGGVAYGDATTAAASPGAAEIGAFSNADGALLGAVAFLGVAAGPASNAPPRRAEPQRAELVAGEALVTYTGTIKRYDSSTVPGM